MRAFPINPVFLKELRQSVRSRLISFSIGGLFLLLLLVFGTIFGIDAAAFHSNTPYYDNPVLGPRCFYAVSIILLLLILVVYPFAAFSRLSNEHHHNAQDLLFTAPLSARQIIDGKLANGFAMTLLFTATALPFILLSYHLRGIDLYAIASLLVIALPTAIALLAFSLLVALLPIPHSLSRIAYALFLFFVGIPSIFTITTLFAIGEISIPKHIFLILLTASLGALILFRSLAIFAVAPPTTNHSRPLRRTLLGLWLFSLLFFAILTFTSQTDGYLVVSLCYGFTLSSLCLYHAIILRPVFNRRTLSEIRPRFRFLQFLTYTSSQGGILLSAFLLALTLALTYPLSLFFPLSDTFSKALSTILPLCLYTCACAITLRCLAPIIRPLQKPLVLFLTATILPFAWSFLISLIEASYGSHLIPGNLFASFDDSDYAPYHILCSAIAYTLAFAASLPSILRAWRSFKHP